MRFLLLHAQKFHLHWVVMAVTSCPVPSKDESCEIPKYKLFLSECPIFGPLVLTEQEFGAQFVLGTIDQYKL